MNTNELQRQIELAREVIARNGYKVPAIVTENRLSKNARKTFWGFRFQVATIGTEITNDDGSFSVVRAVVAG
jgi:hypothetical protein